MTIRPVREMIAEAKARVPGLAPAEAQAEAEAGRALLIDIRDIRELARDGCIPGAFHAPRGMLEFWIDPTSPYHKPALGDAVRSGRRLVLFCASSWRSALAADTLRGMGLADVAEIDGGFTAWRAAGRPAEAVAPRVR